MIDTQLPGAAADAVAALMDRARDEGVARRIWAADVTLWAPEGTEEIADRLGWLDIASRTHAQLDELREFVRGVHDDGYTDVVLLGMGGSSLAPEVFRLVNPDIGPPALKLHVLDTTEPLQCQAVEAEVDLDRTLLLYSSKSGGTIEPNSLFRHFWSKLGDGRHYAAVTDPGTALGDLATEHGFRHVFVNDPNIGGRYSALSWFGIVPAALAGIDVEAALSSATAAEAANGAGSAEGPGVRLGCAIGALAQAGQDKLTWIVDPPLESFGLWVEQLVAESTGKHGRGSLPVADEPLAAPDAYGPDRVFVHVRDEVSPDAGNAEAVRALASAAHPVITIDSGRERLSELMYVCELAIAVVGWALEINPFDQPNVQEAKDNTNAVLESGPPDQPDGDLADLLDGLAAPSYVAIMGYLPYDAAVDAAVSRLRAALLERHGVATTWGYGPRFLHSTGQFHKGGPKVGRFLQLVSDSDADVEVPGRDFGLRTLIDAQADGDLQTLRSHDLPAVRVRLAADDLAGSIDALTERVRVQRT